LRMLRFVTLGGASVFKKSMRRRHENNVIFVSLRGSNRVFSQA
jgi:hypothetical protein